MTVNLIELPADKDDTQGRPDEVTDDPVNTAPDDPTPTDNWTLADLQVAYGWLPPAALQIFIDAWPESGNALVAWGAVRNDPRYEQWFPGNMTDDGRPRYAEYQYAAVVASYDDVFRAAGIEGQALDLMRESYATLIAGDVSPTELESLRVKPMYDRVIIASDAIRQYYSDTFNVGLSDMDLLTAAMNPALGDKVLSQQISFAEIGGEAAESGFSLGLQQVQDLAAVVGFDRERANEIFQSAEEIIPMMNVLTRRHNDPDDEFDIENFIASEVFENPQERYRMRRNLAQERALFRAGRSRYAQDARGSLTGLSRL